jgi:hypothetical protein
MARRLRKLYLVLLVVGLLGGLIGWRWYVGGRMPAAPPLPNPNGYDDFVKAGAGIIGDVSDLQKLDEKALAALVSTNAEPLRLARVGLSRPCEVPFTENYLPDLSAMKHLAQMLAGEGKLAELQGRSLEAAHCYVDAIQLGNACSQGGFIIHRLVGAAIENIGYARLVKLAPALDCSQTKPILERLQSIDQNRVQWSKVLQAENRFVRAQARKIANPITLIISWWRSRGINQRAGEKHDLSVARLRLMMIHLALRCQLAESGRLPLTLQQLQLLRAIPPDPFSGQPFIYAPTATNWLLYSVGVDRVDDKGRPVGRAMGSNAKGDLFFDSPP